MNRRRDVLTAGTLVAGYRIDGVLGMGGMGIVYEATQLSLNRKVALKVISPNLHEDEQVRERFRREGLRQANIDHPNIVAVHEAGETEEGLFFAMRLVRGPTLKDLIVSRELDAARTIRLLSPVADALGAAHEASLIHRDVKPQNILVGARDHAYLADFGLTKVMGERSLTSTGRFVGTLDYMSPEQIRAEPTDGRTDTYSLAAVLYECLTGVVPYPKDSEVAVLYSHLSLPPPSISKERPELPEALDGVVARGMAKEPDARFPSPVALIQEAEECFGPQTRAAMRPPPPVERAEDAGVREAESRVSTEEARVPAAETLPSEPHESVVTAQLDRPGRSRRSRLGLLLAALAAVVLVGGYMVGASGSGSQTASHQGAAGPARLQLPATWRASAAVPEIPGLRLTGAHGYSHGLDQLVVGTSDGAGATLLPSQFLPLLDGFPSSQTVRLGRLHAYRYRDLRPRGLSGKVTLFVVPTASSVVTVGCLAGVTASTGACERVAGTLRVVNAKALELGPRAAYASAINSALSDLRKRRTSGRDDLHAARTSSAQSRAARRLAGAASDAAAAIRGAPVGPAERPTNDAIVKDLKRVASAYSRLSAAAKSG
ncbi:MAG: serine/threonine-protein kinase, partial [Thermoleophilaceae bacterium]